MKNKLTLIPILLRTEDASNLVIDEKGRLDTFIMGRATAPFLKNQHLHLCSSREIGEEEYFECDGEIYRCFGYNEKNEIMWGETPDMYLINSCKKSRIEFTSDPALIKDEVPALPEKCWMPARLGFLSEFVSRYNQRRPADAKPVDAEKATEKDFEKIAGRIINPVWQRVNWKERIGKECFELYNQALQSNVEGLAGLLEKFVLELKLVRMFDDGAEDEYRGVTMEDVNSFVRNQSLSPASKGGLEIFCEVEEHLVDGDGNDPRHEDRVEGSVSKIKLVNGQPIIHFG